MSKFIKYAGDMFLNSEGLAVYEKDSGKILVDHEYHNRRSHHFIEFNNIDEFEAWWDSFLGNKAGRLQQAIEQVTGRE